MISDSELLDRLADKFTIDDGCWEWTAGKTSRGYGAMWDGEKLWPAHRLIYDRFVAHVPNGVVLDHLCRNTSCVRPDHLDPTTDHENVVVRGTGITAVNAKKTHCIHGHEFTEENTYSGVEGHRFCRPCRSAAQQRYRTRLASKS